MIIIPTPLGDMEASFDAEGALTWLGFAPSSGQVCRKLDKAWAASAKQLESEMAGYFSGDLQTFSVPIAPSGTPFQMRVWELLKKIPYGGTTTYGQVAKCLGDAKLSRAVGRANGANPISIIVPCHRVIGTGGKLTGYASGLWRKEALLKLESAHRCT